MSSKNNLISSTLICIWHDSFWLIICSVGTDNPNCFHICLSVSYSMLGFSSMEIVFFSFVLLSCLMTHADSNKITAVLTADSANLKAVTYQKLKCCLQGGN